MPFTQNAVFCKFSSASSELLICCWLLCETHTAPYLSAYIHTVYFISEGRCYCVGSYDKMNTACLHNWISEFGCSHHYSYYHHHHLLHFHHHHHPRSKLELKNFCWDIVIYVSISLVPFKVLLLRTWVCMNIQFVPHSKHTLSRF